MLSHETDLIERPTALLPLGPGSLLSGVRVSMWADGRAIPPFTESYTLPAGRFSFGPSGERIYAAKLTPRKITFGGGSVQVVPTIDVSTPPAGGQAVRIAASIGERTCGIFATPYTRFDITVAWYEGGLCNQITSSKYVSCLDPATRITLYDGQAIPIRELVAGEYVRNPITGAAMRIQKIIYGPEPFPLIGVESDRGMVWFSKAHPVPTLRGYRQAIEIEPGDCLIGDGAFYRVLDVRSAPVHVGQKVYNLEFEHHSANPTDHLFLANGIVVGDYWLQDRVRETREKRAEALPNLAELVAAGAARRAEALERP